ncbi:hypothetical protein PTKIN_Ptkin13bG0013600 [Pterospermum kingtungense]
MPIYLEQPSKVSRKLLSFFKELLFLFGCKYVDYLFGDENEARTFSKVHGGETDNVEEIALKISQWPKASGTHKRITVITQGADQRLKDFVC